jgi:hypothetical protein
VSNEQHEPDAPIASSVHSHDIARAVGAYARHLAGVQRHRAVVMRLQAEKESGSPMMETSKALAAHRTGVIVQRSALRESVRAFARALRAEHVAPELALKQLKETLRVSVRSAPGDTPLIDPDALVNEAVGWAIDAYYEAA